MNKVAIVADSTCCLPREQIDKYNIHVVPLQIVYQGQTYRDGIDISPGEVYKIMRKRDNLPTTSNPLPRDFLDAYKAVSNNYENILCITVTSLQSKTFDTALMARDAAEEVLPETNIEVMDSRAVAGALGFIVLEAARAAENGEALADVLKIALKIRDRVNAIFMLDTLYFLARTGRIAKAAAWAGSLLDMKPIVEHVPAVGETAPVARLRSKKKAISHMLEILAERVGGSRAHIMVHHADELEEGKKLLDEIGARCNCAELYLTEFTPGMGVHCGPGLLAISFYAE